MKLDDQNDHEKLYRLCQEHNRFNGVYPEGVSMKWESTQMVRSRVINCLKKHSYYMCVVVSGHAMMMEAVLATDEPIRYGQVMEFDL